MARRSLLTVDERRRLFDPLSDQISLMPNYTLSPQDCELIGRRHGSAGRLGFAMQIALMRYPGFGLQAGAIVSDDVLKFVASQLHVDAGVFHSYPHRQQTRIDHGKAAAKYLGLRSFRRSDLRELIDLAAKAVPRQHLWPRFEVLI